MLKLILDKSKDQRTNWRYIFIILLFSVLVGGGILLYQYRVEREISLLIKPIKILKVKEKTKESTEWKIYKNEKIGFEIKYPENSVIKNHKFRKLWGYPYPIEAEEIKISIPFKRGTTLISKELTIDISRRDSSVECLSDDYFGGYPPDFSPQKIHIGDIEFTKEIREDAGVGHHWYNISYSTKKENYCISLVFTLHSVTPGVFLVPPPEYDFEEESKIFYQILSTFRFLE